MSVTRERLREALSGAVVAHLGQAPAVVLVGPDARRFANGMFTNNVRDLAVGGSQRSAMTDDRGRLVGLLDVHALADDRFLVLLDGLSVEAFVERYDRYVVFDDVELQPLPGLSWHTVQGERAADALAGLPVPSEGHLQGGGCIVARRDRGGRGFDVLGDWPAVADPDGLEVVQLMRRWSGEVSADEVQRPGLPHEHGLRGAVLHFAKGCYLGQEAIHRLEVQGNPRRGLYRLRATDPVPAGAVQAPVGEVGRAIGGGPAPDQGWFSLAVLRRDATEGLTVEGVPVSAEPVGS